MRWWGGWMKGKNGGHDWVRWGHEEEDLGHVGVGSDRE